MNILNPGSSVTLTLGNQDSVTVSTRDTVVIEAVSGLGLVAGVIATLDGARTFGPYPSGSLKLTALGGDCSYGVVAGTTAANFATDASGNVTGLVGPSGAAIRIQAARLGASLCAVGDSITAGAAVAGSYYTQMIARSLGAYKNEGNFAIPGKRSDEVLAVQIPLAVATNARYGVHMSGVNDIIQGVPEATLRANVIAIFAAFRAAGMIPVDIALPPTNTAANVARYVQHNIWRKLYCLKNNIPHIDPWGKVATPAGAWLTGLNVDAIHPNSLGAIAIADELATSFANGFRNYPLLALTDTAADAGSLFGSSVSFGGVAGNLTTSGFNANGSGGAYAVNAADAGGFGNWLRCTMAGGSIVGYNSGGASLASLGWAQGDTLLISMRMRWADSAQALAVSTIINAITLGAGGGLPSGDIGGVSGNDVVFYSERVITVGAGGAVPYATIFGTGTGYFEINRPIIVNLTKLGLA